MTLNFDVHRKGWHTAVKPKSISSFIPVYMGFPGGSDGKASPAMWETWVRSLGWEDLLEDEEAWQPTPVFLPGESHGQGSLVGYSPWGRKELDMTKRLTLSVRTLNFILESLHLKMYTCAVLYNIITYHLIKEMWQVNL